MAGLTLKGITKSFGSTRVLNGIDLDIRDGEFLTLVGPSGCGKSTLLRIIAGLEAMDAGALTIDGRDVSRVRAADRNLAMVFQSYALYPHLTVAENMMTPLKLRDLNWRARLPFLGPILARSKYRALMDQVRETSDVLKITPLLQRKPGQLSGGQRQRAALGRAMVRNPMAFLMDEPLSNLDAALRVHMRSELADLHASLGTTFIYVTHDQAEALTMSDRMAVMMHGDILQLDTPAEIYNNPNHVDVARFVGSPEINLLPAETDERGLIHTLGLNVAQAAVSVSQIGIRCEHLKLVPNTASDAWRARIVHLENLGADVFVHCVIELGSETHRLIVRTVPGPTLGQGQAVSLRPDRNHVMAFAANGMRMETLALPEQSREAMPA